MMFETDDFTGLRKMSATGVSSTASKIFVYAAGGTPRERGDGRDLSPKGFLAKLTQRRSLCMPVSGRGKAKTSHENLIVS